MTTIKTLPTFSEAMKAIAMGGHIEVTEDTYYEMLGAVPPVHQGRNSFVCGEAYTHNEKGTPVYYCFYINNGEYFGMLATVKTFLEFLTSTQPKV